MSDSPTLRLLLIEDNEADADQLVAELEGAGMAISCERVDSDDGLGEALGKNWDAVICDYVIPDMDWARSLSMVRSSDHLVPFIVVSGQRGEEFAVETMRGGVHDYIVKSRLMRLAPAVEREVASANDARRLHRARETADEAKTVAELRLSAVEHLERQRIARALHDGPLQMLVALSYQLNAITKGADAVVLAPGLEVAALDAIKLLRGNLHDLVPSVGGRDELAEAFRGVVDQFSPPDGPSVTITDDTTGELGEWPVTTIFRVGREGLINALFHADASTILVRIWNTESTVDLSVVDDGKGFDVDQVALGDTQGLPTMRDRVREVGGTFSVRPGDPTGTQLLVSVPRARLRDLETPEPK